MFSAILPFNDSVSHQIVVIVKMLFRVAVREHQQLRVAVERNVRVELVGNGVNVLGHALCLYLRKRLASSVSFGARNAGSAFS